MNKFKNKLFTKKNVQVLSKNEQLKVNGGDDVIGGIAGSVIGGPLGGMVTNSSFEDMLFTTTGISVGDFAQK